MLILFKPWYNTNDLRKPSQTWEEAFHEFDACCSSRVKSMMTNMQLLHECRENSTDHFASRRNRRRHQNLFSDKLVEHPDDFGQEDQSEFLEHKWRLEYETRRDIWKKKIVSPNEPSTSDLQYNNSIISDGSHLRYALQAHQPALPIINQEFPLQSTSDQVDINDLIEKNSLNTEQARAFRLIAEHSLDRRNEQLRMYLGGAGGTGKSRIISVLREFFVSQRQEQRFQIVSYTGIAAKIINGMTIHQENRCLLDVYFCYFSSLMGPHLMYFYILWHT